MSASASEAASSGEAETVVTCTSAEQSDYDRDYEIARSMLDRENAIRSQRYCNTKRATDFSLGKEGSKLIFPKHLMPDGAAFGFQNKWYDASGSHVPSDISVHDTFMRSYWMRNETEHILKLTELEKRIITFVWKVDPRIFRDPDVYMAAYWPNSKSRQEEKDAVNMIGLMAELRRDMGCKPNHARVLEDACALYDAQVDAAAACDP